MIASTSIGGWQGKKLVPKAMRHEDTARAKGRDVSKWRCRLVERYIRELYGMQPRQSESVKLFSALFFIDKLRDAVSLYLSPPENALVLCVDEKCRCQMPECTHPMLPMGIGYVDGVTHDYKRHGTTTLFAALNILNGAILGECKQRHRHQEFLAFLREIDKAVPADLDIHCIVDNYGIHEHAR